MATIEVKNAKLGGNDLGVEDADYRWWNLTMDAIVNQNVQIAENAVRILQSNNVFTNGPNLVVDEMTDSTGTKNTVNTDETSAIYDSGNDLYKRDTTTDNPFVIIEATSLTESDFSINNCTIAKIETGKWQLICTTGDIEVKRAQIYKTLFYGTNGTDARASSTYITGITALKTSVSIDVGKQAHYASLSASSGNASSRTYTGTFADTSGNTDCSSWSYVSSTRFTDLPTARWEIPSGTTRNTVTSSAGTESNDEIGTDLTSDETDNPTNCQLEFDPNGGVTNTGFIKCFILCSGDITWAESGSNTTFSNIDFLTDNSIPAFTATTEEIVYKITIDTNTLTLDGNEKGFAISVPDSDFPTNTGMTVTISDGTNSLTATSVDTIKKGIVIGNSSDFGGPLSSGTLKATFTLTTSDTSVTPTLPSYGVNILR